MNEPDSELVEAAKRGDVDAFTDLVRYCQADVFRLLKYQVGDADLAADLAQETFLRVHQRLPEFRGDASFSGWILRIARNQGIDALRSRTRRLRLINRLAGGLRAVPMTRHAEGESQTELSAALATLPDQNREAFVLVEVLGYKYREAALVLAVPDGTVKGRVFRARKQLIDWFDAVPIESGERR
ncbi:MAG: RNA polymerase sigma factor [Acidimicrobiales bacterium]